MDGLVGRQEAQGVATDVAEHTGIGVFAQHLVECGVDIAVATALAQCGRTRSHILAGSVVLVGRHTECAFDEVGIQLARTGQLARQPALDDSIAWHDATHLILDERLTFLTNQHLLAVVSHAADELLGYGVLRNLQHGERTALRIALHQVVVGYATGYDAQLAVVAVYIPIIFTVYGHLLQQGLLTGDNDVALAGKGGQQHPRTGLGVVVQLVLGSGFILHLDDGTRVGHAGSDAHQHRQTQLLRKVERLLHHVVGLLLRTGFQRGNHRKLAIETRVLLVLAGVHRRVVGNQHNQSAIGTRHSRVDERVGADIQSHVFHADQCALAHERHA